jgi:hypothetical protein
MNNLKRNIQFNTLLLLLAWCCYCAIFSSCSSSIARNEIWEGIHGATLRVFVKIDVTPDFENNEIQDNPREKLRKAGRNRAGLLLLSYVRTHVEDMHRIETCRQAIPGIIEKESVRYINCHEESCTGVYDFDIRDFLEAAGTHETR